MVLIEKGIELEFKIADNLKPADVVSTAEMSLLDVITRRKGEKCNVHSRLFALGRKFILGHRLLRKTKTREAEIPYELTI